MFGLQFPFNLIAKFVCLVAVPLRSAPRVYLSRLFGGLRLLLLQIVRNRRSNNSKNSKNSNNNKQLRSNRHFCWHSRPRSEGGRRAEEAKTAHNAYHFNMVRRIFSHNAVSYEHLRWIECAAIYPISLRECKRIAQFPKSAEKLNFFRRS